MAEIQKNIKRQKFKNDQSQKMTIINKIDKIKKLPNSKQA